MCKILGMSFSQLGYIYIYIFFCKFNIIVMITKTLKLGPLGDL